MGTVPGCWVLLAVLVPWLCQGPGSRTSLGVSVGQTPGMVSAAHSRGGDVWVPMGGPSSTASDPASVRQSLLDMGWQCAGRNVTLSGRISP